MGDSGILQLMAKDAKLSLLRLNDKIEEAYLWNKKI